jgi:hypothetical protein
MHYYNARRLKIVEIFPASFLDAEPLPEASFPESEWRKDKKLI